MNQIPEIPKDVWEKVKPQWEPHAIHVGKFGEAPIRSIPSQLMKIEAPADRILAVPVLVPMDDRGLLMLSCNTDYAENHCIHYAARMYSRDCGETWEPLEYMNDDRSHFFGINSMTAYLGDGRLLAYPISFDETAGGWRFLSEDCGRTWRPLSEIQKAGRVFGNWDPPMIARDGAIWETYYDVDANGIERALYRVSHDGGVSFGPDIEPEEWNGANEVKLFELQNGTILAGCRMANRTAATDQGDWLAVSRSEDRGATWSPLVRIAPEGRMHPSFVELPDGRVILTYVVREGYPDADDGMPRFGIEAVESIDGGVCWDTDRPYRLAETKALYLGGEFRWASSVQSTSSILQKNGEILTAFGTGHRCRFNERKRQLPRDIWLVRWKP